LLNGTLTADKLRITGGGEIVRFEGNVVMNLDNLSPADASGPSANAPATPAEPAQPKTRSIAGKSANPK
jgi:lipopolysaccharide export system protein LptC